MGVSYNSEDIRFLEAKALKIRKDLLNFIYRIGMGHLGGELSMVDVAVALYYRFLNIRPQEPHWEDRDRFVLSKGHCSETLFTIFSDLGLYTQDYMVEHFEALDKAVFGMHSNRKLVPMIELSAGSLGHGLPVAVGMALGARLQKKNWRTFVMVGDGELDEGTNWEALMAGANYQLGNLVAIVDRNTLQMTGHTEDVMRLEPLADKVKAFGWNAITIDGHNMEDICRALSSLPEPDFSVKRKPTFIISKTIKGKGVDFMEDVAKWHGGGIAKQQLDDSLRSLERVYGEVEA